MAGAQGQPMEGGIGAEAMEECGLLASSHDSLSLLPYTGQDYSPGVMPLVGWVSLPQP